MKNVVILGGGYGGIKIAAGLAGQSLPDDVRIVVVDRNPYHSLKTEFYTIAAGTSADRDVRMDFPDEERIEYVFAEIEQIDTEKQNILFRDTNRVLPYDYLVVG